ncbi:hypothetical protein VP01_3409g1 [Puccinia sorghi]|uniref:Uncharacterized protein n=1 Tax=Puccinia sorghi TaxID=27349 RepID=A0A0L6UXF7_9BASI|nr:hypothetical protein VP01_3409g1 [Puccinia sorghi]
MRRSERAGEWSERRDDSILQNHTNQAGDFKALHINPTHSSNNLLQTRIIHCWFIGRKNSLKLGQHSPQHILVYNSQWIFRYQGHFQEGSLKNSLDLALHTIQPACRLNKIHINKMITMQGPLHVQTFTLEKIQKPCPTQLPSTPFHNVPLNLPINFYCSKYLSTLSEQEKRLLSIRPEINFSKLLSISKT